MPAIRYSVSSPLRLISTLEGRNGLALGLVQSGTNNLAVLELDLWRVGVTLE